MCTEASTVYEPRTRATGKNNRNNKQIDVMIQLKPHAFNHIKWIIKWELYTIGDKCRQPCFACKCEVNERKTWFFLFRCTEHRANMQINAIFLKKFLRIYHKNGDKKERLRSKHRHQPKFAQFTQKILNKRKSMQMTLMMGVFSRKSSMDFTFYQFFITIFIQIGNKFRIFTIHRQVINK